MNVKTGLKAYLSRQYGIMPEALEMPGIGECRTYGIQIVMPEYTYMVHDVSACKKTAGYIAEALNRLQVSPVHLYDVVMDMLP